LAAGDRFPYFPAVRDYTDPFGILEFTTAGAALKSFVSLERLHEVSAWKPLDHAYDAVVRNKQGVIIRGRHSFSDDYAITNASRMSDRATGSNMRKLIISAAVLAGLMSSAIAHEPVSCTVNIDAPELQVMSRPPGESEEGMIVEYVRKGERVWIVDPPPFRPKNKNWVFIEYKDDYEDALKYLGWLAKSDLKCETSK
jgi:hypothetical protein